MYKEKYKVALWDDIDRDFSGDELAHVETLMAKGQTARSGRPARVIDMDKLAQQIYDAINGLGTDEEAVYSALAQLNNNPALIKQLKD